VCRGETQTPQTYPVIPGLSSPRWVPIRVNKGNLCELWTTFFESNCRVDARRPVGIDARPHSCFLGIAVVPPKNGFIPSRDGKQQMVFDHGRASRLVNRVKNPKLAKEHDPREVLHFYCFSDLLTGAGPKTYTADSPFYTLLIGNLGYKGEGNEVDSKTF